MVDPSIPVPAGQYGPELLERLWSPDLSTAHDAEDILYFVCSGNGGSVTPAAPEVLPFTGRTTSSAASWPGSRTIPTCRRRSKLVLAVGELAPHAVERREDAVVWLRQRTADAGKGEEPDMDDDTDAWLTWMEQHGHDVRTAAVVALSRALRPL